MLHYFGHFFVDVDQDEYSAALLDARQIWASNGPILRRVSCCDKRSVDTRTRAPQTDDRSKRFGKICRSDIRISRHIKDCRFCDAEVANHESFGPLQYVSKDELDALEQTGCRQTFMCKHVCACASLQLPL